MVVIPAHNEEAHIEQVIRTVPRFVDEVIVVDDGSTDRTPDLVLATGRASLTLLRHEENRGVGAAVVSAYRTALEREPDVVVLMQGDGQTDPSHLDRLVDPIVEGRCDFAKGNRFFSRRSFRGMPVHRVVGNVGLSTLTKAATGYWDVFDSLNGYTAISAEMLRRLPLERLESRYELETLMLFELSIARARVLDVPIPAVYGEEVSGINPWREGPRILWTIVKGLFRRVRVVHLSRRPTAEGVAFVAAWALIVAGAVGSIWAATSPANGRPWLAALGAGLVLLAAFFVADARATRRRARGVTPTRGARAVVSP